MPDCSFDDGNRFITTRMNKVEEVANQIGGRSWDLLCHTARSLKNIQCLLRESGSPSVGAIRIIVAVCGLKPVRVMAGYANQFA